MSSFVSSLTEIFKFSTPNSFGGLLFSATLKSSDVSNLPRVMVYHVERAEVGDILDSTFQVMEMKLLRVIMNPALIASWFFGVILVMTPGIVDWSSVWPWLKTISVVGMTWFHHWLSLRRKDFKYGSNTLTGRQYRIMNEVPTILMIVIVISVVVKF